MLLMHKSGAAAADALRLLEAYKKKSPILQQRYRAVLQLALKDPDAEFSGEERRLLASHLDFEGRESRSKRLQIRVTPSELQALTDQASEMGCSVAELVRVRVFG